MRNTLERLRDKTTKLLHEGDSGKDNVEDEGASNNRGAGPIGEQRQRDNHPPPVDRNPVQGAGQYRNERPSISSSGADESSTLTNRFKQIRIDDDPSSKYTAGSITKPSSSEEYRPESSSSHINFGPTNDPYSENVASRNSAPEPHIIRRKPVPTPAIPSRDTVDTTVEYAPAVVHETRIVDTHHIIEEHITRSIHHHDINHRVLPVVDVEVLTPRHFIPSGDGGHTEISEEEAARMGLPTEGIREAVKESVTAQTIEDINRGR